MQTFSAAHTFDLVTSLSCLHVTAFRSEFSAVSWVGISVTIDFFSAFSDLVDLTCWGSLHFRFLCSVTLFPFCFFAFPRYY